MAQDKQNPFYLEKNEGINECTESDELLHPQVNALEPAYDVVETQYFSVNIPENSIYGVCYLIHHPHLRVVSGGVWIWKGMKPLALGSEIFDMREFMSDKVLENNLHKFTLDNGYSVEIIKPLEKFHVGYKDPIRHNSVDLNYSAVTPPVMFGDNMHFEQGVKVEGEIVISGEKYVVDSYSIRDRSWGRRRPEHHVNVPPIYWTNCTFNEDFVFNCVSYDSPGLKPEWKNIFDFPEEKRFLSGWIYKGGILRELIDCRKITTHDKGTLFPTRVEMEIEDSEGESYRLKGEIMAASRWAPWSNFDTIVCLTRWECEGLVGYGDTQMYSHHDFLRAREPAVYSGMLDA